MRVDHAMRFFFPTYWPNIIWMVLFIGLITVPALADEHRDRPTTLQNDPEPAATEMTPDVNPETYQRLIDKANQAIGDQRYEEAQSYLEQALVRQPADYDLIMLLVHVQEKRRAWGEVEANLSKAVSLRPNQAYPRASRGYARLNLGRIDEAEADFQEALKHDPDATLTANVQAALKQIKQSRTTLFRPIEEASPPVAEPSLADQAFTAYQEDRYEEARRLIEKALAESPGDYHWNMLLVNILEREKAWPEVEARLTMILADRPNDAYALASRGFARLNQARRAAAADDFHRALEQNPEADLLGTIHSALEQIQQTAAMENAAREAKPPQPSGPSSGDTLLSVQKLIFGQQYDQAARLLKQLNEHNLPPQEKGLWLYLRAELLWHEEQFDQAFPMYQQARLLLPEKFYQAEIWWRLAEYERGKNQAETAMEYARKSVELLPDSDIRNLQVAYLFLHFQQDAEAVRYFETALAIKKTVPEEQAFIYMDLSYAYKRLGDNERQLDRLERYIDLQDGLVGKQISPQKTSLESLYDARREHADLVRRFGWYSGNYYNLYNDSDYAFQAINDVYWQPWYSNGRSLQFYGQLQATLTSRYSSSYFDYLTHRTQHYAAGYHFNDSVSPVIGLRVDPLTEHNLVLTLEKIFEAGRQTRDDFRGRIGYSWDTGLELEPFEPNWLYSTFFNELTHSFQYNNTTYYGEARVGRSFRLDWLNDRLVATPHLVGAWGYGGREIAKSERWSLEAGGGLHLRQWYREDTYNAPQSYTDIILQYRFGLSHNRDDVFAITLFNSF